MRFLLCADLHASNTLAMAHPVDDTQVTDRLVTSCLAIKEAFKAAVQCGSQHIFFLGDLFDRKHVDLVTLKYVMNAIVVGLEVHPNIHLYLLPGNHDAYDSAGWHYSVDVIGYLNYNNLHILGKDVIEFGSGRQGLIRFCPLPYANGEVTTRRLMAMSPKSGCVNILLAHHDIIGAKKGDWTCDTGIEPKTLSKWSAVFSGHYHEPQSFGDNIVYVGAMLPLAFGDTNKRGFVILDVDGDSIDYDHNTWEFAPIFADVKIDLADANHQSQINVPEGRKAYVRVFIKGNKEALRTYDYTEMDKWLSSHGVVGRRVEVVSVAEEKQRIKADSTMSAHDLIRSYVEDSGAVTDTGLDPVKLIELGTQCFDSAGLAGATNSAQTIAERARLVCFQHITIKGFASFGNQENSLRLSGRDLVLISGKNKDSTGADSNGAGKSNVFKALTWCLWGQTVDGMGLDVINRNPSVAMASVSVVFTLDGVPVRVNRIRGKSSYLTLSWSDGKDWTDASASSMADTQTKINNLIGMDFTTFRNTVLYGQGDANKFSDIETTDSDRKAVLKRALRLEDYDLAQEAAKSLVQHIDAQDIEPRRMELIKIEAQIGAVDMNKLRMQQSQFEDQRQSNLKRIESDIARLSSSGAAVEVIQKRISEIDSSVATIDQQQSSRVALVAQDRASKSEVAECDKKIVGLERDRRQEVQKADSCMNHHDRMSSRPECPECGALTTDEHVVTFQARLLQDANQALDKAKAIDTETKVWKDKRELAQEQSNKMMSAIAVLDRAVLTRNSLTKERSDLERNLRAAAAAKQEQERFEQELERVKGETNPFTEMVDSAKHNIRSLKVVSNRITTEIQLAESLSEHYKFWVKGFGNQGLPSYILDTVIPVVTARANDYLGTLSDGNIIVSMDTESELKGGGKRDKISVKFKVDGVDDVIPSGGQRRRASLAIGLALTDLVSSREATKMNMLMLDEVLDGLDKTGKSRVLDLLMILKTKRDSIFVVSHDPDIVELFNDHVDVIKENHESRIVDGGAR